MAEINADRFFCLEPLKHQVSPTPVETQAINDALATLLNRDPYSAHAAQALAAQRHLWRARPLHAATEKGGLRDLAAPAAFCVFVAILLVAP